MLRTGLMIILMVCVCSCASSGVKLKPLERTNPFPEPDKVRQIAAKPTPKKVFETREEVVVEEWKLVGPLPDTIGLLPHARTNQWDELLAKRAEKAKNAMASEAMQCVARENAVFFLKNDALPSERLSHFIQRRCGSISRSAALYYFWWEGGDEQRHYEGSREDLSKRIKQAANAPHPTEMGIWYGKVGDRTAVFLAHAQRAVDIDPIPMRLTPGQQLHVRGRVHNDIDYVYGAVNRGRFGYARCETMPRPKAPQFHIVCQLDPADPFAAFEVGAGRKTALYSNSLLVQMVWPAQAPAHTYVATALSEVRPLPAPMKATPDDEKAVSAAQSGQTEVALGGAEDTGEAQAMEEAAVAEPDAQGQKVEAAVVAAETKDEQPAGADEEAPAPVRTEEARLDLSDAGIRQRFLGRVNEIRGQAKLPPVTLAPKQSDTVTSIAPHYFQASMEGADVETLNEFVYGILAGWDVEGDIIEGDFSSGWTTTSDAQELVDRLFDRPSGRRVLLAPEAAQIALGSHLDEASGMLGGVVVAYEFLEEQPHTRRVEAFLGALDEKRAKFGNKKAKKIAKLKPLENELARKVRSSELKLHEAATQLWEATVQKYRGQYVYVYMLETHSLDKIDFPKELLGLDPLHVSVMVVPYKPEGYPWSVYGIAIAYPKTKSPTELAQAAEQ